MKNKKLVEFSVTYQLPFLQRAEVDPWKARKDTAAGKSLSVAVSNVNVQWNVLCAHIIYCRNAWLLLLNLRKFL